MQNCMITLLHGRTIFLNTPIYSFIQPVTRTTTLLRLFSFDYNSALPAVSSSAGEEVVVLLAPSVSNSTFTLSASALPEDVDEELSAAVVPFTVAVAF